jgi:RNA polymerase sigma-70 factor, ECF subfamily
MSEVRELIREQIPALRRYARALMRDKDGADDLVQDCLVRAINAEAQWKPGTNIRAWLFTILHNIYVGDRRKLARRPSLVPIDGEEWRLDTPANQVNSVELGELDRALASLPEQQRITVLLVGLQGMGYEEVAEVMGVPLGTVRSRLSRARQTLHHLINMSTPNGKLVSHAGEARNTATGKA